MSRLYNLRPFDVYRMTWDEIEFYLDDLEYMAAQNAAKSARTSQGR